MSGGRAFNFLSHRMKIFYLILKQGCCSFCVLRWDWNGRQVEIERHASNPSILSIPTSLSRPSGREVVVTFTK